MVTVYQLMISANGKKKSFGSCGSAHGQFNCPEGLAGGNILVAEWGNHRIQQFSSTGKTVGTRGSGHLQFHCPVSFAVHPHTHKVYVADYWNHRIQVLNSDLTYSSSFGSEGSNNGEFYCPYDISTDRAGNLYVADYKNHRIQVFTVGGEYSLGRREKGREN